MTAFDFVGVVDRVKLFSDDLGALFAVCGCVVFRVLGTVLSA